MNFLELVVALGEECGVAGTPTAVTSQTGEYLRLVNWINRAWKHIQLEADWRFRFKDLTPTALTIGQQAYSPASFGLTDFDRWDVGTQNDHHILTSVFDRVITKPDTSVTLYKTSTSDQTALPFLPFEQFRSVYQVGAQTNNRPQVFTVARDNSLLFGPTPDYAYTIGASYIKSAGELSATTDTPDISPSLHMIIVYKAMQYYGAYENAQEVYANGVAEYGLYLKRLHRLESPRVSLSQGSLA